MSDHHNISQKYYCDISMKKKFLKALNTCIEKGYLKLIEDNYQIYYLLNLARFKSR